MSAETDITVAKYHRYSRGGPSANSGTKVLRRSLTLLWYLAKQQYNKRNHETHTVKLYTPRYM
jgi:hypothetical protein